MNYKIFEKAALLNSQFEIIPPKVSVIGSGATIDNDGNIQYKGKTYITKIVELDDLPPKLQQLFLEEKKNQLSVCSAGDITIPDEDKKDGLGALNKILFEQLQNIVDPEDGTDMQQELKKANAVCNVADKIISIADLSLRYDKHLDKKMWNDK